ncbi:hypothetical protein S7711_10372 [Stachybotrys chartarum IBT 7711]|uniref:Uncharacterized protein n=1 Tax=Stachybotrys chartarum (strain CBS 109288 / IBT 7711) TaxID=1280523 RepID=A0A084ATN9_STACB|nr:hypothetical protein S7711_10372 [Stachybotrys chartarum IBT 7711]KFA49772.1 hypothetical protein S40293_10491 [Stachybotrys chartarum IBT 40293]KFA79315.1 hypothetical protein S40288_10801 [Stachybotrys chartarum IBT 40288]
MTTLAADPRMHGQDGTLQGMSVLPFDRANGGAQPVLLWPTASSHDQALAQHGIVPQADAVSRSRYHPAAKPSSPSRRVGQKGHADFVRSYKPWRQSQIPALPWRC